MESLDVIIIAFLILFGIIIVAIGVLVINGRGLRKRVNKLEQILKRVRIFDSYPAVKAINKEKCFEGKTCGKKKDLLWGERIEGCCDESKRKDV